MIPRSGLKYQKAISLFGLAIFMVFSFFLLKEITFLSEKSATQKTSPSQTPALPDLEAREVGSANQLWINGYLGEFFRFSQIGYWSWLAVPLLFMFFLSARRRKRWEIGLACIYIISLLLIGLKGYINPRYALTLLPMTLFFILWIGSEWVARFDPVLKKGLIGFLVVLMLVNVWQYNKSLFQFPFFPKGDRIPWGLFRSIGAQTIEPETVFLTCNAPIFSYYLNKKSITYSKRIGLNRPGILSEKGIDNIFQEARGTMELDYEKIARAFEILRTRYRVRFIFMNLLPDYYREFSELVNHGCELMGTEKGYSLYRLRESYFNPSYEAGKREPFFENHFSELQKSFVFPPGELSDLFSPLTLLGSRGTFRLETIEQNQDVTLRFSPIQKDPTEGRLLFLGYWLNHSGFTVPLEPGQWIVLKASLNISSKTIIPTQLLIQDQVEDWDRAYTTIDKSGWNQYFIAKKIRGNAKDLIFGISWQPDNELARLEIKGMSIYIIK